MERKRMYVTERDALTELVAIANLTVSVSESLKERSKSVKRARSLQGLMRWAAMYLLEQYLKTVPQEQLLSIKRNLKDMQYTIGTKSVNKDKHRDEWGLWVSYADLQTLADSAKEKCLTCDLCDGRERSCPLRIALDTIGTDEKHDNGCAYRWM